MWPGAHIVGGARDARRSAHTAQAKHRHAPDVRRKPHPVDQPGVDGRAGNARDRREKKRAYIAGLKSGGGQGAADRAMPQIFRLANPVIVSLSPCAETRILLDGQRQVTAFHAYIVMKTAHLLGVGKALAPILLKRGKQSFLRVIMLRKSAGGADDSHPFLKS